MLCTCLFPGSEPVVPAQAPCTSAKQILNTCLFPGPEPVGPVVPVGDVRRANGVPPCMCPLLLEPISPPLLAELCALKMLHPLLASLADLATLADPSLASLADLHDRALPYGDGACLDLCAAAMGPASVDAPGRDSATATMRPASTDAPGRDLATATMRPASTDAPGRDLATATMRPASTDAPGRDLATATVRPASTDATCRDVHPDTLMLLLSAPGTSGNTAGYSSETKLWHLLDPLLAALLCQIRRDELLPDFMDLCARCAQDTSRAAIAAESPSWWCPKTGSGVGSGATVDRSDAVPRAPKVARLMTHSPGQRQGGAQDTVTQGVHDAYEGRMRAPHGYKGHVRAQDRSKGWGQAQDGSREWRPANDLCTPGVQEGALWTPQQTPSVEWIRKTWGHLQDLGVECDAALCQHLMQQLCE
eukprot:gene19235-25862_t